MAQFVVIGLGAFGFNAALELMKTGNDVLAIDCDGDRIQAVRDVVTQAVHADATDSEVLRSLGVKDAQAVIVSVSEERFEATVLITVHLKELKAPRVVVKVASTDHETVIQMLGADEVVFPERDMACRVAQRMASPTVFDRIDMGADMSIIEMIPPDSWLNQALAELNLRRQFSGLQIVLIRRGGNDREDAQALLPTAEEILRKGDVVVLLGNTETLAAVQKLALEGC